MVLKTFEVRDFKHLLENNGHDSNPFIQPYIETFGKYPAAISLIMEQVKENEDEQEAEERFLTKARQKVGRYQIEMENSRAEVNRMRDTNNQGQYEDFESRHYRFNRANDNQVQFKPSYQEKKRS